MFVRAYNLIIKNILICVINENATLSCHGNFAISKKTRDIGKGMNPQLH